MDPSRTGKVFGIGLNKTGTRSVAAALRILGFRTLHKGDAATSQLVVRAAEEERPLLQFIGTQYDAYFDVEAIVRRFRELDRQYRDSRFILTTSQVDYWLESRRRHVEANQRSAAEGRYAGAFLDVDLDQWRADWEDHHIAVRDYFEDMQEKLLVFDVRAGDGWTTLAPFLGCPIPRRSFPWENRGGSGTYAHEAAWRRAQRRLDYAMGRARRIVRRRWPAA